MEPKQCSNCFYGVKSSEFENLVICKRFPSVWDAGSKGPIDKQPNMKKGDWCGEHKDK